MRSSSRISTKSRLLSAPKSEVSDWIEVTQELIDQFAEATGDNQWIDVDVERANRELPGRGTIAHGLLTLGLAPGFIRSVMRLEGIRNTLNYGAESRLLHLAAVPAGSRLRGRITIAAIKDAPPDGLRVTYGVTIDIEGGKRPACVAEVIAVHYR